MVTSPDWALGTLFGLGGLAGMYTGALLQKFFSANVIKAVLGVLITVLAIRYLLAFLPWSF